MMKTLSIQLKKKIIPVTGLMSLLFWQVGLRAQQPDFTAAACPSAATMTVTVTSPGSGGPYAYALSGCGTTLNAAGQPGSYTFTGIPNRNCFTSITVTDNAGVSRTRNVNMPNIFTPGVARVYTYPCGPGNYVIIPIGGLFSGSNPVYRIYAADGTTLVAGPQSSNVFPSISGNAGDVFVVSVERPCHTTSTATITLGTSTTVNARVYCVCLLDASSICSIGTEADGISGAAYTWISPMGTVYNGPASGAAAVPENNGTWQLTARITTAGCVYDLTSSPQISNCISTGTVPIRYNYVRTQSRNCRLWLQWSTALQEQTDRFDIECSDNGETGWVTVESVPAAGNLFSDKEYEIEIPENGKPYCYVRIRQVDKDERNNYSAILKAAFGCRDGKDRLNIAPNPVPQNGKLSVSLESSLPAGLVSVQLTDYTGRSFPVLPVRINRGPNRFDLPVSHLPKGIYILQLKTAGGNWQSNTATFIVQ